MKHLWTALGLGAAVLLSACGEKEQELSKGPPGTTVTRDTKAYSGDGGKYRAAAMKPGDKAAWETQLKQRMQSQDEYTRAK